jgi:hypothetical protein
MRFASCVHICVYGAHPDEAVVEVHPDETGGEAGVPGDGTADGVPHDVLGKRAALLVKTDLQARRRRDRHGGGHQRCACKHYQRPHGRHGYQLIVARLSIGSFAWSVLLASLLQLSKLLPRSVVAATQLR